MKYYFHRYRRKIIYGELRQDAGKILRWLCELKDVEILEAHAMPDHIHMLVKIPPKTSVSSFMGYLKGRSTVIIHERHANLKYNYGNRNFWKMDTVGLNQKTIEKYIREQEAEERVRDSISKKEYTDPFKK